MSNTTGAESSPATQPSIKAEHQDLLTRYQQFSPLEARDKPMIADLEQKIADVNKQQIQHLATQLTTIHEQHRLYTDKSTELTTGYDKARQLKTDIAAAEHAALARDKSYQETFAASQSATLSSRVTMWLSLALLLALMAILVWWC